MARKHQQEENNSAQLFPPVSEWNNHVPGGFPYQSQPNINLATNDFNNADRRSSNSSQSVDGRNSVSSQELASPMQGQIKLPRNDLSTFPTSQVPNSDYNRMFLDNTSFIPTDQNSRNPLMFSQSGLPPHSSPLNLPQRRFNQSIPQPGEYGYY